MVQMESKMANRRYTKNGIKLLVQKCREQFRISENLEHYSDREYREAERKYVKLCLRGKIKYLHGAIN
jgi:hypothetical protein